MKYLYALIVLLMALFFAAFIQQNSEEIVLKYFYWRTIPLPLSLFMILAFAGGYALAVIVGLTTGIKNRLRASGAVREARRLRAEVNSLRETDDNEPSPDSALVSEKNRFQLDDDVEDDTYTTVKFPTRAGEDDKENSGGKEEKGDR
jgi:uncharacterized integral membrane protein